MKKLLTITALSLLSAAALNANAQVTLDGQVLPAEGYVQLGMYSGPHGFGDHGLVKLYVRNTATKYYIALTGALEQNGNSFQIYLNQPRKTGVAANTTLPVSSLTGTSFEINDPKMDFEVDYGFGVKGGATVSASSIIDYTRVAGGLATDQVTGDLPITGTALAVPASTTGGLQLTRMAFKNVFFLVGPVPATPLHTGIEGWEIELDKASMNILPGDVLQLFAVQSNQKGDYYSTDAIPEVTGNTSNLGASPNFVTLPGTQFVSTTVVTSVRNAQDAAKLNLQVAPNPMSDAAKIHYTVADRASDVEISLKNLLGQEVRQFNVGRQAVGQHELSLAGAKLAAGTYVLKVQAGNYIATQKVVVE
ncbi:T9SS type A sorting domain-containing protein [Hymenobacter sp. BT664]|uniref:T9SS type A sorting domain-containing protein n=1 Tax=Hymenobacter montanus TaxID=2771359 RepID=A0A927BAP1_9BACT|nr:T9SS type A sorting domain-containing protein [Hymenobacter montanus]MBD2766694.1 T9SS type A sorting domain-containing protein [Hymenobacter montanus]